MAPAPVAGSRAKAAASVRRWLRAHPADVVDVFVYVVVLNLAAQYVPAVIVEGFSLSLATAVLLKVVLEVVVLLKGRLLTRVRTADALAVRVMSAVGLWVFAAGSKFVVLELEDLVFGDAVELGGFVSVTLLVVALLLSRIAVRCLLAETWPDRPPRAHPEQMDHPHTDPEEAPETRGVEMQVLTSIDLGPEIAGMEGHRLRMRLFTFAPGAVFGPVHDHRGRPGAVYVLAGTITDHRDGRATEYGPGPGWPEDHTTVHWLENAGSVPATEVSVDIVAAD